MSNNHTMYLNKYLYIQSLFFYISNIINKIGFKNSHKDKLISILYLRKNIYFFKNTTIRYTKHKNDYKKIKVIISINLCKVAKNIHDQIMTNIILLY